MVPAGKLISILYGIMMRDTKVCAQYFYETGVVARRIWPVRKNTIAAAII
jgi:hypothetical protein